MSVRFGSNSVAKSIYLGTTKINKVYWKGVCYFDATPKSYIDINLVVDVPDNYFTWTLISNSDSTGGSFQTGTKLANFKLDSSRGYPTFYICSTHPAKFDRNVNISVNGSGNSITATKIIKNGSMTYGTNLKMSEYLAGQLFLTAANTYNITITITNSSGDEEGDESVIIDDENNENESKVIDDKKVKEEENEVKM